MTSKYVQLIKITKYFTGNFLKCQKLAQLCSLRSLTSDFNSRKIRILKFYLVCLHVNHKSHSRIHGLLKQYHNYWHGQLDITHPWRLMDFVEVGKFQENSGDRLETTTMPIFPSLEQKRQSSPTMVTHSVTEIQTLARNKFPLCEHKACYTCYYRQKQLTNNYLIPFTTIT